MQVRWLSWGAFAIVALVGCGDDTSSSGGAAAGGAAAGGAAAGGAATGGAATGGAAVGGGGAAPAGEYFEFTAEFGGSTLTRTCTRMTDVTSAEALGVEKAGTQLNIKCPSAAGALVMYGGSYVSFQNIDALSGAVTLTEADSGYLFDFENANANGVRATETSTNLQVFSLQADVDHATGRITGTVSGTWSAPNNPFELEGTFQGSFSVIEP